MKYAHQFLVTTVSLIAIVPILTAPLPAGAVEIHGTESELWFNVSLGHLALTNLGSGHYNTAFGSYALHSNTGGNNNTASGAHALKNNTEGNNNTASGAHALINNS